MPSKRRGTQAVGAGHRELTVERLIESFDLLDEWEARYGLIIELGKTLAPLVAAERTEANRVQGCMSNVWIVAEVQSRAGVPVLTFRADSDAFIVKGLVALLVALYSGKTAQEALMLDADAIFERLHLFDHLSPSRHVGMYAMVERIRHLAARYASDSVPSAYRSA